jgi:hypothetical protein
MKLFEPTLHPLPGSLSVEGSKNCKMQKVNSTLFGEVLQVCAW